MDSLAGEGRIEQKWNPGPKRCFLKFPPLFTNTKYTTHTTREMIGCFVVICQPSLGQPARANDYFVIC